MLMILFRHFTLALFILFFARTCNAQCPAVVRQEWNQLGSGMKTRFVQALQIMYQRGVLDRLTAYHYRNSRTWHNTPIFLFAHRYYIIEFERELRLVDPGLSVPYWDWSAEALFWQNSDVWNYFGGSGSTNCLTIEHPWIMAVPRRHCVQRTFDGGSLTPSQLIDNVVSNPTFISFSDRLEIGPHAQTHFAIGGDFATMFSPNDPVFFIHHAYIDKIFYDWQIQHGNEGIPQQLLNRRIPDTPVRVRDMVDVCYTYTQNEFMTTFIAFDVSQIEYPIRVSDDFIDEMRYPKANVRNEERKLRQEFVSLAQKRLLQN